MPGENSTRKPETAPEVTAGYDGGSLESLARLEDALLGIGRLLFHDLKAEVREVSPAQLMIMKRVQAGTDLVAKELAVSAGITEAGVSQIVAQLRRRSLLQRRRNAKDRRRYELLLTEEGRRVLELNRKNRSDRIRQKLAALTYEEQNELTQLLERLMHRIEKSHG